MYLLDTLDPYVPTVYLGPLGIFWKPWTFGNPVSTLDLYVSFGHIGPLGTYWIPWTFKNHLEISDL